MRRFMLLMLLLGSSLLGVILYRTNLGEAWERLAQLGVDRLLLLLGLYLMGTLALTGSWLLTLSPVRPTPTWLWRLWRVWLVGNALEYTTPFGTLGGEPAKAILLKRHYGLRVRDVTSSLVLTRMTDLVAQLVFIGAGFALILRADLLPLPHRVAAASGLLLLSVGSLSFYFAQQHRMLGRVRGWLERGWLRGRQLSAKALAALDAVHDIDEQLALFYRREKARFWLSVGAAFLEWTSGALVAWAAINAVGYPISFAEALMIEAFLALVRSTLFFVPADVGTQEGALVLICAAITGSPATGLALAAIRRTRDILLVATGLAIGSHYSLRDRSTLEAELEAEAALVEAPAAGPARR
jgi:uncharacterized protein (TIRG00374 family)